MYIARDHLLKVKNILITRLECILKWLVLEIRKVFIEEEGEGGRLYKYVISLNKTLLVIKSILAILPKINLMVLLQLRL